MQVPIFDGSELSSTATVDNSTSMYCNGYERSGALACTAYYAHVHGVHVQAAPHVVTGEP